MKFDWDTKENKQFLNAILSLENKTEAKSFLRDLMTEGEIVEFGKRLEAARLLSNDTQYALIIERTGLSSTTIARISKWLRGSLGGYRMILSRTNNLKNEINNKHHNNPSKIQKGLPLTR